MIKANSKEEWLNCWSAGKTGRSMYGHISKPLLKDPINDLRRGDQSLIFQLRTHHVPLNYHLNRIGVKESAACPLCDYPTETVDHLLVHCRKLTDLRGRFLPPQPGISNCLYTHKHQLQDTCIYTRLAFSRRANPQMLLVR